jgi:hypothetical protein
MLSRLFAGLVLSALAATGLPVFSGTTNAGSTDSEWTAAIEDDAFVYYEENGETVCRPATAEEARAMAERDERQPLRLLMPEGLSAQDESKLNIMLRGTAQLDSFPQARDGFLRAAETWKSRIQPSSPITIIIDVDFGTTRFGQTFPQGVLGSTNSQSLRNTNGYAGLRNALIQKASNDAEAALLSALPQASIPTDIGEAVEFIVPSALLRALGIIGAVADPSNEQAQFGSPPSIGFNSNFAFDFDPSNGIDADKTDFDAVAVHEIGHLLGFTSRVGAKELNPSLNPSVSIIDLMRFRPGVTMSTFTTAQRPLSSGGEHRFFAGLEEVPLSTGRPDGSGGDGNQASHWKDDALLGRNIGIMDPRLGRGERAALTDNDLKAYDVFGYTLRSDTGGGAGSPAIGTASGDLLGDMLTLSGTVSDPQGDIVQAEVSLLNSAGGLVSQYPPTPVNTGGAASFNFSFQVAGLNDLPAATRASLVFIDGQGNRSSAASVDFSRADPGGPNIKKVKFSGSKLTIKGGGFNGLVQVEINGVLVAAKNNGSNGKVKINGNASALNIREGANRVRVFKNGLRSNISVPML